MSGGGWKNWLFGGFELSWIQTLESGNPLTFSYANSPYDYYPTFAGSRRPDVLSTPSIADNWRDMGGDRFNQQNRNPIIDMNHFSYPGGTACPTSNPTADQRARGLWSAIPGVISLRVRHLSRLRQNFHFSERYFLQLRFDFQNALKTYNFDPPTTAVDFQNPLDVLAKLASDPRTASLGGQPLMNLTLMLQW